MRCEFAAFSKSGVQVLQAPVKTGGKYVEKVVDITKLYTSPSNNEKDPIGDNSCSSLVYSPRSGSALAVVNPTGVSIFDTNTRAYQRKVTCPKVQAVAFSPLGNFLLTWTRHVKGSEEGNMVVWRLSDGEEVARFFEKSYLKETWPAVQWTDNEEIAGHMVKNTVHLYRGSSIEGGIIHSVKFEGVSRFALGSTPGPECTDFPFRIATFKGEAKGKPAQVGFFNFPGSPEMVRSKSFFRAEGASLQWNSTGTAVLAKTETTVDATGESYYGESGVHLIRADEDFTCSIRSTKEGLFQDVAWSPKGKEFIAIAGKMPAAATLYNLKGEPVFEFGNAHRNTIKWSPHGRFVCMGGFGNLAGDMDFWDINKKKLMGSAQANCAADYGWSPCGRFFIAATLFPRMRVDNGFTVYSYRGEKIFEQSGYTELYSVCWRPSLPDVYPDRPQSPLAKGEQRKAAVKPAAKPKPFQAYRPPGASSKFADMLRADREGSGPKKVMNTAPVVSKAKARRERKKLAAATKAAEEAKKPAAPVEAAAEPPAPPVELSKEKQLRKCKKLLKTINAIEEKKKKGEPLNDAQLEKLARKAEVMKQIEDLS